MKKYIVSIGVLLIIALAAGCSGTKEAAIVTPPTPGSFDRTVQPTAGPHPALTLPEVQNFTLSNGLQVKLVEHHELPVIDIRLVIKSGSFNDPPGYAGVAGFTADMLDEGTETRTAFEIADAKDFLGASLGTGSSTDATNVNLTTLKKHLDAALEIFSDVLLHPSFPEEDFEKMRDRRLTSILQRQDQPVTIARLVFNKLVFGGHPLGTPSSGTKSSISTISRDDLLNFYTVYYKPNNAVLIVVGDITVEEITPLLEKYLSGWKKGDVPPTEMYDIPTLEGKAVYLYDKPKAPQSYIYIGHKGIKRSDPDYINAYVMNMILGGQFSSRINLNLREEHGYTYGARSSFGTYRNAGSFIASSGVKTAVTDSSIFEFMYELRRIRDKGVTEQELAFAKTSIIQGLPSRFETPSQIASRLSTLVVHNLPDDYYNTYVQSIQAVTSTEIKAVAIKLIDIENIAIVVVGDSDKILEGLKDLEEGPVVEMGEES